MTATIEVARQAAAVVQAYWERMQARDWAGVHELLDDEVTVEWPASGERFRGADAVVDVNRLYPEGWSIRVVGVIADREATPQAARVVSEVEVVQQGAGVFAATSLWEVREGRIAFGREYWVVCGGDEPPQWRSTLSERYDGRPE